MFGDVTRNAVARFIRTEAGGFRSLVQFPVVIKRTDAHPLGQLCHSSRISFCLGAVFQKESVPLVTMTDIHIYSIVETSCGGRFRGGSAPEGGHNTPTATSRNEPRIAQEPLVFVSKAVVSYAC